MKTKIWLQILFLLLIFGLFALGTAEDNPSPTPLVADPSAHSGYHFTDTWSESAVKTGRVFVLVVIALVALTYGGDLIFGRINRKSGRSK